MLSEIEFKNLAAIKEAEQSAMSKFDEEKADKPKFKFRVRSYEKRKTDRIKFLFRLSFYLVAPFY